MLRTGMVLLALNLSNRAAHAGCSAEAAGQKFVVRSKLMPAFRARDANAAKAAEDEVVPMLALSVAADSMCARLDQLIVIARD
jgi:hypothetical protein